VGEGQKLIGSGPLRPVLVIWGFGYLLVDITVAAMGRMAPGVSTLASVPLFVLAIIYTLALERVRQWMQERPTVLRWLALGSAVIAATAVHALFDLYYFKWLAAALVPDWQRWASDVTPERIFTVSLLYLWTFCLALTLLWAAHVGSAAERETARAALLESAKHRAEAVALRLQLNPHFLFNTLNSISSLVAVDRKRDAETMISRLADFLRASLESDPMASVTLSREIETIDAFLQIEEARFGDRLEVEISIDGNATELQVPNFILQPLVENAIKYGVASKPGRGRLLVSADTRSDELVLRVENRSLPSDDVLAEGSAPVGAVTPEDHNLPGTDTGTGIGLANIRQRLMVSYGEQARLETEPLEDGYRAVIRLPLHGGARSSI
jgi:LytS/YehU family sensor histidine kinase